MKQDKGDKKELFYSHKPERKYSLQVQLQLVKGNILCEEKKYYTPKRKRANKNNINFLSLNKRFEEKENKLKEDEDKKFYEKILHSIINNNSNSIIKKSKNSLLKSNKDNSEKADSNTFADKNLFKNIKKMDIPNKNIKHLSMEIPNRSKKQLSVKNHTHSKFEKISLSSKGQSQNKEDFPGNNDNPLLCLGHINNKVRNSYPSTNKKKEDVIKSQRCNKLQKSFDDASSCVVEKNKNSSQIKADLIADIKPTANENENSNKNNFINNNDNSKSKRTITICCIPFKRKNISAKSYLY